MDNKGRNYMYYFSALGINCMLCLSSRTWNGHVMFMCVYSLRHFGGGVHPTKRSHPKIGEGYRRARLHPHPCLPFP
jgi:hypothetical protein